MSKQTRPYRVLIEANKLLSPGNDGIKRYLMELLYSLAILEQELAPKWQIDLYIQGGHSIKLSEYIAGLQKPDTLINSQKKGHQQISGTAQLSRSFEYRALRIKDQIRQYLPWSIFKYLSGGYERLPIRFFLSLYREWMTRRELRLIGPFLESYDLIHVPLPQNLAFLKDIQGKFLVTVHDISHKHFPQFHTQDNISRTEKGMQQAIQHKAHYLTVSIASKWDIVQEYSISPEKVNVIYEACSHDQFRPNHNLNDRQRILEKYGLPDQPYFLTLSTLEPRKNLINTIKAFHALQKELNEENIALFICGKKGWRLDNLLKKDHISAKNIFFTGYIHDEDLPVLYAHSLALCYISFYEGFGLPPLEAMACGTTVIYGNNSSMPEVIAKAGLPADPHDVDYIKAQMKALLQDDSMRTILNENALKRAQQFSWMETASQTLRVYEQMISVASLRGTEMNKN